MKFLITLVLFIPLLFAAPSQAVTNTELVDICGPDPANYSVTLPGNEWACEQAAALFEQAQKGVPPAPVPASCVLPPGSWPEDITGIFYPNGTHAWHKSGQGGVLRVDRILAYSVNNVGILAKDIVGLNYTLVSGFAGPVEAQTCLNDLIGARRL